MRSHQNTDITAYLQSRGKITRVAESATSLVTRLDIRDTPADTRARQSAFRAEFADGRCEDAPCCGCCGMLANGKMMVRGIVR